MFVEGQGSTRLTYEDPTEKGLDKCFNTWIHDTLLKAASVDEDLKVGKQDTEVNLDYELADTL